MIPVFAPPFIPAGDWWYSGSEVDLDFTNARYHDDNAPTTDLTSATVLMLHCDGADASTNFSDSTGRHFVVPRNSAQIDTAQSKFGGASLLTTSATSDAVQIADGISDFDFGTGDFTIDLWIRLNAGGTYQNIFDMHPTEGGPNIYQELFVFTENTLVYRSNGAARITGTTALSTGVWYHVAVARSSGNTKMFLGGVQEGSTYADTNDYEAGLLTIGATASNLHQNVNGWIDEFRVLKGVAAWTANFTPPTAPYDVGVGPYDLLSCSRASIGYAQTVAGTLTQFASNALRITDQGLLVEDARTNVVLWNRDLTNGAWTASNITAAKDQTGPDGVGNSASSITATAGNGTILQAITLASSARYQSAWVKRITGSGVVEMTMDNGATWTAITVTGSWTRVTIPTQTLANPTVGFRIVTSGDAIAVDFVQNEDGAFASSPIPTTTVAAARAADTVTCIGSLDAIVQSTSDKSVVMDVKANMPVSSILNLNGLLSDVALSDAYFYTVAATDGAIRSAVDGGNILIATGGSLTTGAKIGESSDANGRSLVIGGGTIASDAAPQNPNSAMLLNGSTPGFWNFRRLTAWTSRLADATLQSLTS